MEAVKNYISNQNFDDAGLRRAQNRILAMRTEEDKRFDAEDKEVITIVHTNYERWRKDHPIEASRAIPITAVKDEMIDDLPDTYVLAQARFKCYILAMIKMLIGIFCIVLAQQEFIEPIAAVLCAGCWWVTAGETLVRK